MARPLEFTGDRLLILDQTRLPHDEVVLELEGADDTADAIRRLAVRGAPLIGVAAAYGLALAVQRDPADLDRAWRTLRSARPTAANLAWAVDRVRAACHAADAAPPPHPAGGVEAAAIAEARAIEAEDIAFSAALAEHGADALEAVLPPGPVTVATVCNSGALAASGRGSGLGVILALADRREVHVLACETRPLLQGARLTAWELDRAGVSHAIAVDSAVPGLIARGEVHAVVTGLDRVAANGDVVNKVGTYPLALAARAADIPFVAAGPSSSVDHATPTGRDIEIEERDADEVRGAWSMPGTPIRNPAFDVTPAELVWALVTEAGVTRLPA